MSERRASAGGGHGKFPSPCGQEAQASNMPPRSCSALNAQVALDEDSARAKRVEVHRCLLCGAHLQGILWPFTTDDYFRVEIEASSSQASAGVKYFFVAAPSIEGNLPSCFIVGGNPSAIVTVLVELGDCTRHLTIARLLVAAHLYEFFVMADDLGGRD